MSSQNSAKGNPASTRMSNKERGVRRQNSWARGVKRRTAHREAQDLQELANRERRVNGELTPWEKAQLARIERRAADPVVRLRRRTYAS